MVEEITPEAVKGRAIKGVLALTSRSFILQAISFLTTFSLTIFLAPSVFGVFFIVSAVISFLSYFSDIGLAAALIQKKGEITQEDLSTTFTIQQFLVGTIVVVSLSLSGRLASFYSLGPEGLWLFRAFVISFLLSSLKTIPSVLLERRLDFNRLVIPQIVETTIFSLVAVILAFKGFGTVSFTWAVLGRGLTGLITIYILAPWRISFGFSKEVARHLLSFGLPFQANSILALIKDDLFTIFLGKVLPFSQVGYIGWAKKWAEFPLRLVMDNVIKVTFPAYARLQNSPGHLSRALDKSIFFVSFIVFPASVALVFLVWPLVFLLPKYIKWEPALFSFYFFVVASILASISTPLTNVLNAIGKIRITLRLMILWTILTWIIGPLLVFKTGFNGVALASVLIAASTVLIPVWVTKKFIRFNLMVNILPAAGGSFIMATFFYLTVPFAKTLLQLSLILITGGIIYLASVYIITRGKIWHEVKAIWQQFRS